MVALKESAMRDLWLYCCSDILTNFVSSEMGTEA